MELLHGGDGGTEAGKQLPLPARIRFLAPGLATEISGTQAHKTPEEMLSFIRVATIMAAPHSSRTLRQLCFCVREKMCCGEGDPPLSHQL